MPECSGGVPVARELSKLVDIVGINFGATICIRDGYATLVTSVNSGTLYTDYSATLSFVFTDYQNALGYAAVGAAKGGSRILLPNGGGPTASICSMTRPVAFTPGNYSVVDRYSLIAYAIDCGKAQSDALQLGDMPFGQLTIALISGTRIQGSLTGTKAKSTPDAATGLITFDIPLLVYSDGGTLVGGGCCLQ